MRIFEKTFLYVSSTCLLWVVSHDLQMHSYDSVALGALAIASGLFALAGAWVE